ncbi:MAG: hypothetical protein JJU11_01660 [Candidatus Sumerlaeia bacterium]|nr:hypothetical protein [Candidatus Sumerlaeia bacterium]
MTLNQPDRSISVAPLWLELSGLPLHLNETAKVAYAWGVFSKIVQLDMARNPRQPGIVEISPADLAMACGLDTSKIAKAVKGMRKTGILRAFLAETPEEAALFQVITPTPTPMSADHVRSLHPDYFLECPWPPRYAIEVTTDEGDESTPGTDREKIKKVAELYLDVFSMKINPLVLDELQLISDRYDFHLIRKIFLRARDGEARSLGWVLTEIRREGEVRARIEKRKREEKAKEV